MDQAAPAARPRPRICTSDLIFCGLWLITLAILCYLAGRTAMYDQFMASVRASHERQEAVLSAIAHALRITASH